MTSRNPGPDARLAAASGLAALCLLLGTVVPSARAQTLGLGIALPLSGTNAALGRIQKNAYLMAADAVNRSGGVKGMPLELEFRDTGGRTESTRAIMDAFVLNRAYPLVLGGLSSRDAAEMARKAERLAVPVIVAGAAAESVTKPGSRLVFRVGPPLPKYPLAALSFAHESLSVDRAVILAERTPFGDAVEAEVRRFASSRSWSPPPTLRYEAAQTDLQPVIEAVVARDPAVVFMVSLAPDAARIVQELRRSAPRAELVGLSPAFTSPSFARWAGDAEGVFATVLWSPALGGEGAEPFRAEYLKLHGEEPDYHGAEAFAALTVAADALRRAQDLTAESIRSALAQTQLATVCGTVSFPSWDGYQNQNPSVTGLAQWQDGAARLVWPEDLRAASPVLRSARAGRKETLPTDPTLLSP